MKRILTTLLMTGIIAVPAAPAFAQALAQSTELENAKQAVVTKVAELQEAKGGDAELDKRLEALTSVVAFSIVETEDLIKKLEAFTSLSVEATELQNILLDELADLLLYQKDFFASLEDADLTLDDVKALAAQYKEWRDNAYTPHAQKAVEFVLVFQGAAIVKIGESRFKKIADDLRRLKSSKLINVDELRPLLEEAGQFLKNAIALQQEAADALLPDPIPLTLALNEEEIIEETGIAEEVSEAAPADEVSAPVEEIITIKGLITESVDNVKAAYGKFLAMSELVREMLNR